eukprot:3593188-Karenia_brevis.AAC.1
MEQRAAEESVTQPLEADDSAQSGAGKVQPDDQPDDQPENQPGDLPGDQAATGQAVTSGAATRTCKRIKHKAW